MTRAWLLAIACAGSLGCGLWSASASVPSADVEVTSAPIDDIETYPSTVYEGRNVYLYNDHWYYRNGSNWQYYRQEPQQLVQHRQRFQAQPARRQQQQQQPQRRNNEHEQQQRGHH